MIHLDAGGGKLFTVSSMWLSGISARSVISKGNVSMSLHSSRYELLLIFI
jgi:hypothetical protein